MSHQFFEGKIFHKRHTPTTHAFTYRYFFLDIDLDQLDSLENTLFGNESFNLFSFRAKDHFGQSSDFKENVAQLLKRFNTPKATHARFITLPRILNFVFNPISLLLLFDHDRPVYLLAEVHNYNGGRVIYPVPLNKDSEGYYLGHASKEMYVSPFYDYQGEYRFKLRYEPEQFDVHVDLEDESGTTLHSHFSGRPLPFRTSTVLALFARHTFLTLWVVTRTLWQTFKLWRKGLKWHDPRPNDQLRRY